MRRIYNKFKQSRIAPVMLVAVVGMLILLLSFSYAMFTASAERRGSLNIMTGNLFALIESPYLNERKQITLEPGETKRISLRLININNTEARLNQFWWTNEDAERVEVNAEGRVLMDYWTEIFSAYGIPRNGWPNYFMSGYVTLRNNECFPVTFNFGATAGLPYAHLEFPEGKNTFQTWSEGGRDRPGEYVPRVCEAHLQARDNAAAFWVPEIRNNISHIYLADRVNIPDNAISVWDVSRDSDRMVRAFIVDDVNEPGRYILHIQAHGTIIAPPQSGDLFGSFENVITINNLNLLDTSNVTNMNSMFSSNQNLTFLDVSNWDTSNVTNMTNMFGNASSLTTLDLNDWDIRNVWVMHNMFANASSLTTLDLNGWDTRRVEVMSRMFEGTINLTSLGINEWNTSSVRDMSSMFRGATSLTSLDLNNWDTVNVTNMSNMFEGAINLTSLGINDWNTSNVRDMSSMFASVNSLTTLNLNSWNTGNVTNMSSMFESARSLSSLGVNNWNVTGVANMSRMFANASSLTAFDAFWLTGPVATNMSMMFAGATSLTRVTMPGSPLDMQFLPNVNGMFSNTPSLREINFPGSFLTQPGGPPGQLGLAPVPNNATYTGFWVGNGMRFTTSELNNRLSNVPPVWGQLRWERR